MRRLFHLDGLSDGPLPPILLPLGGVLLALALSQGAALAAQPQQPTRTIYMPARDGYGLADCLRTSAACARSVANALCSANGLTHAIAWGSASDFTGSTGQGAPSRPGGELAITCAR